MNQQEPEATAQPDAHYHHAFNNLPDWLLKASPTTRNALKSTGLQRPQWHDTATREQLQTLKNASEAHWAQRNRLEARLDKLQNARDFAEPLLVAALKKRFGVELDVKTTFLRLYLAQSVPWFPISSGAARTWTVSLLDAALHNFQASETRAEAHEPDSTFITEPSPSGQFDTLPAVKRKLSITAFTRLCRELDIGGQYQAYLKESLGLKSPVATEVLKLNVINTHKTALRAALHLAHIRRDVPVDAHQALLGLLDGRKDARLHAHDLSMMSSLLTGIVVFAPDLGRARQATRIVVYIPDDPEAPLKHYPDSLTFIQDLTRKLRSPTYQAFFSRFVDHQERGYFFAGLAHRLIHVTWHERQHGDPLPSWRDTPIDKPHLQFFINPIKATLWTHLYQQQLNKLLNDARTVAVSTASADRAARWARWDAFSKVATDILEVVSFVALPFVPFLGEAMLAYMAYQVLDNTFEGIVDWAEGLQREALEQVITLTESVVQLGLFAVGGAMAMQALSRVLAPETLRLFSSLKPVKTVDGKTRYWRPDLAPYEQSIELPKTARPDQLGLYQHQGKQLLRLEDKLYAVKQDSGRFQIEHPQRDDAWSPPLRHNHHGAWQTLLDEPLTWDRDTVMRRLGHRVESLGSTEREHILRISGFHDNVLRETHVEHQRPPSLLTDTLKRFKIDRDIQVLIEQPGHPERERALSQRLSLFEERYRELEQTDDRNVQLLQGNVQGLPTDIAEELVSNATGSELMEMHNGRVPRRLKDVALKAMDAVRTARAYEGFYLHGMETVDTRRLALHSLESMPGWPADLRIEVREYSPTGALLDSIGPDDAPVVKTLVNAEDSTLHLQGSADKGGSFYQAIVQALSEPERNALGLSDTDAAALKQRIIDQAASTPALRTLLVKHPLRKPFYDPATMRLPGGSEGYFRRHAPTPTLIDRVREVYPGLGEEELGSIVARLQRHPDGPRTELSRLAGEFYQLHWDLDQWVSEAPTINPETGLPLDDLGQQAMRHNRRLLAQEIQRSWRRQSERDVEAPEGAEGYVLRFTEPVPGSLPELTADFSHVSALILEGNHAAHGAPRLLQQFTGLRRLELRGFSFERLPDAIGQMENLEALILSDCGIPFDSAAWTKLSSMKKLQRLDLQGNPFDFMPPIAPLSELSHLNLSNTGLTAIPDGALQHPGLNTLLLTDNAISELPAELFDSPVHEKRGVHLMNNPLSEPARELIKQHYFETSYDLGVAAPEADVQRVIGLYPDLEPAQASDLVYAMAGTLADGRIEIGTLEVELAQMNNDLTAWTADLPPVHPLTGEPFTAHQLFVEHVNRDTFMQTLQRCWRHQTELDEFDELLEPTFELVFDKAINGDLPTLSADFSHVSALELTSANGVTGIGRFLESFPKLKRLKLRDFNLGNIPDAVFKMDRLFSLSLQNCRITLTAESASALAGMEGIEYLDLAFNPLEQTPDLSRMPNLATLVIHDTRISEIPNGLQHKPVLDWADLSNNAITDVPSEILALPGDMADNIHLQGNPFTEEALQRLTAFYENTGVDFGIGEVINQGEAQGSTSPESEVDE